MNTKTHIARSSGRLSCDAPRAWKKVCFYEHIETRPSWLLRVVLPVPHRTSGGYRKVGDVSRCLYSDGGYLTKQIRKIEAGKRIAFDIIEQSIRYAGRIVLKGGTIEIEPHDDGTCSVHMLTRYERHGLARLVPRLCIDFVVSAMHKIVIRDMQAKLASSPHASEVNTERASLTSSHGVSSLARVRSVSRVP